MFGGANAHRLLLDGTVAFIRKLRYLVARVYVHTAPIRLCATGGTHTHPVVRVFTYQSDCLSHPTATLRQSVNP